MNSFEAPFTVDSDIELGKRAQHYRNGAAADVTVRRGSVPFELDGEGPEGGAYQVRGDRLLIRIPRGPRLLVENGTRIVYCGAEGHDDRDIALFLLGSAWGALCYQRGLIPIQASAVATGDRIHAFTGHSGTGKSTLAAALAARGRAFFTDDLLIVDPGRLDDRARCFAGETQLKLWENPDLAIDAEFGEPVRSAPGFRKRHATPRRESGATMGRLADLIVLQEEKRPLPPRIEAISGGIAVKHLAASVYRPAFAAGILGRRRLYEGLGKLVGHVAVHRFHRRVRRADFEGGVAFMDAWIDARH